MIFNNLRAEIYREIGIPADTRRWSIVVLMLGRRRVFWDAIHIELRVDLIEYTTKAYII